MSSLLLRPVAEATPQIGAIIAMLEATRASTLAAVEDLSPEALAYQADAKANPIGCLLAHIAAIEWAYLSSTLEASAEPSPSMQAEWARFGPLIRLGPEGWAITQGRTLVSLLADLHAIRARTVAALRGRADEWLVSPITLPWLSGPATPFWAWYHVMEDELSHRGQIRFLRTRLPASIAPTP